MTPARQQKLKELLSEESYTIGVEIEQRGISRSSGQCLTEINNLITAHACNPHTRKRFKQVTDGSIDGWDGCEFVSGIMHGQRDMAVIQESVRLIRKHGGRPHISCGIHVHVDGSRFLANPKALIRLVKLVDRYETHMYHALQADALTSGQDRSVHFRPCGRKGWSRPVEATLIDRLDALGKNPTIDQVRDAWYSGPEGGSWRRKYDDTRYRLLNLHSLFYQGTIEFRCFNATVHAGRIKAYIQLAMLITAQALLTSRVVRGKRSFDPTKAHYEVRTWLLKLGAIGDEYKTMRLLLTRHLEGNASWHRTAR